MTRYLSIIILFITLGSCQKDDDSASQIPPLPTGTISEFCPNTADFPEIPGWQYQRVEIPGSIGHNWRPYFLNADKGFLFNASGNLIRTNDRGENWDILYSWWNYSPIQVFFLEDQMHGFIVAQDFSTPMNGNILLKSSDGGETWSTQTYSLDGILMEIFFLGEQHGFGTILKTSAATGIGSFTFNQTNDGGETWTEFAGVVPVGNSANSLHIFPNGFGYLSGSGGRIFKTVDWGQNWEIIHTGLTFIQHTQFLDEMNGFVSDFNALLKTSDGGETWTKISEYQIEKFHFFSPQEGISIQIIGQNLYGDILASCTAFLVTNDGGDTWTEGEASSNFYLDDWTFVNDELGFSSLGYNPGYFIIMEKL